LLSLTLAACAGGDQGSGSKGAGGDGGSGNGASNGNASGDGGANGGGDGGASNGATNGNGNDGNDAGPDCKTTCEADECGAVSDGCGGVVQCLDQCPAGQGCGFDAQKPNRCAFPPAVECTPKTAAEVCAGKCGAVSDGCSDVITCSDQNGGVACTANQLCGGYPGNLQPNACVDQPTCTPDTCASLGLECGLSGDGCGGQLDCTAETGGCTGSEVCGTGTTSNQCVTDTSCTPIAAATACATTCGQTGDGCGGLIDCEADDATKCSPGTTCGGGGVPGQCGSATSGQDGGTSTCTPFDATSVCTGKCGFVSDGCGGAYKCSDHGGLVCNANAGESCGGGGTANACGKPPCTQKTQGEACPGVGDDKSCGQVPNGCGGLIDCGGCLDGQECGLESANVCGTIPTCQPTAVNTACSGKCGVVPDGCGGTYTCGAGNGGVSCSGDEFCGALAPNQCGTPISTCTPKTCAQLGHSCGLASDGCGNAINCWPDCAENNTSCQDSCGDAAQACLSDTMTGAQSCVTGTGGCTGSLCDDVPSCAPNALTRLTGTVRTPGLTVGNTTYNRIPVPNAVVYIPADPNVALPAIFQGVQAGNAASCGRCEDEELVVDGQTVLAAAVTDYRGQFTLEGRIPVGAAFNLVVKAGKWRRVVQVPAGVAQSCASASLADQYTRLARNSTDGRSGTQLPRIAISTGDVDEMECVFRNIGIAESEFTVPSGTGRIHMYRSNGARMPTLECTGQYNCGFLGCFLTPGTRCSNNNNYGCTSNQGGCSWQRANGSVPDSDLYSNQARLNSYDVVVWDCEGSEQQHDTHDPKIEAYVNAGGRMFASHFSYAWIEGNGSLDQSADWETEGSESSGVGFISLPSGPTQRARANPTKSLVFRNWLDWQGALTGTTANTLNNPATPRFNITDPRDRAGANVGASTDEWVYRDADDRDNREALRVQQLSFNTPYGANASNICGRVAYSGFHVAEADNDGDNDYFPDVCSNGELSAQEKVLVFMLFDLAACVSEGEPPQPPECTPKTTQDLCPGANDACGLLSDGCGNLVDCGGCSQGFYCDGSSCRPQQCTPATCASLGFNCGDHADGCGGIARDAQGEEGCGDCTGNQRCGLGGPGLCGSASCPPIDIADACDTDSCGLVSDGCGGTLDCGPCEPGEVCGGGGPNVCGEGSCAQIPKAEACMGFNCGLVSDGCGGTHDCGECTPPDSCGGGGMPNVCGHPACVPFTKEEACMDLECGWVSDGCGGAINCGTCPDGSVCGGAGPNLCGDVCAPTSCTAEGAECGKIGDDCGGILDCGPCPTGETCGADGPNKCGGGSCTPTSCDAAMAECGLIGNGCGGVLDCGPCTEAGESCGGAGVPNQCGTGTGGCNPLSCEVQNVQCGAAGNGCGGLLDCGDCPPGYNCERGECVLVPVIQ
jgi:hypothetical protein